VVRITGGVDLEKSFGPVYARGLIQRGRTAFAVLGVNQHETQSSIDAALTFGILWLDVCRRMQPANVLVEGLELFVPNGTSSLLRERMANLNREAAKWHLFELEERDGVWQEIDCADRGNISTRLVPVIDETSALRRFQESVARVQAILPGCEVTVLSLAEVVFRWRGLEFAKARLGCISGSFLSTEEIVFGVGAEERILRESNETELTALAHCLRDIRHPYGPRHHPLWRLRPERWLESLLVGDVSVVDGRLDGSCRYSQVPAFSAADRAIIDVLTVTRNGRLAVVELKADEDIHLPLQGLDYWSRVEWHHARGEFSHFSYFKGRELSNERPLLFLVAPALRVHPSTDTLLRYISPEIEWEFAGIDERWREGVKVVFRKRPERLTRRSNDHPTGTAA
jgi:hypothetical protein